MLLSVHNLSKSYGAITVLADIAFVIGANERAGVVGANGAGKSTLLRILAGQEAPDAGAVTTTPGVEVGYLPQAIPDHAGQTIDNLIVTALGHLRRLEERMRALEAAMAGATEAQLPTMLEEYGQVSTRFQDGGGYEMEHRIDTVLAGLRLASLPRSREVRSLSGGEKARIGLAALLLRSPDLLLLDEPTNHLDAMTLDWLESYLAGYRGAVVVVSHDRQFLDRAVNRIFEIDEHRHGLTVYEGNYTAYARTKVAERERWEEEYERQREEISELRQRMRVTARQVGHNRQPKDSFKVAYNAGAERVATAISRNVRSAEERLRQIEAEAVPKPPKPMRFNPRFTADAPQSRVMIGLAHISKHLGGRCILRDVNASVGPRARIVLVGPNGAGKTTLLRLIMGLETPDAGEVRIAPSAEIGYLPQDPMLPDLDRTVLAAYADGLVGQESNFVAGLIGHGFFRLEDMAKTVSQLSSGQRRKLEIARLVARRPNVLALDEPTNFVSLDVLEAFEAAVLAFPGPLIVVSHDRWFIQRFGGEVWELSDGTLTQHAAGSRVALGSTWDGEP